MNRLTVAMALWLASAFVVWNVIFDRYVALSATEFTQAQVLRHQRGETTASIHAGFSPDVRLAAWRASLWVSPLVIGGALAVYFTFRRSR